MNDAETAQILTIVEAAWPRGPWPEPTEHMWLTALRSYDFDLAAEAVQLMTRTVAHTPTLAHLDTALAEIRKQRRRIADEAATRAIGPGGTADPNTARRVRQMLAETARRGDHDHHRGPAHCPVCSHRKAPA